MMEHSKSKRKINSLARGAHIPKWNLPRDLQDLYLGIGALPGKAEALGESLRLATVPLDLIKHQPQNRAGLTRLELLVH